MVLKSPNKRLLNKIDNSNKQIILILLRFRWDFYAPTTYKTHNNFGDFFDCTSFLIIYKKLPNLIIVSS